MSVPVFFTGIILESEIHVDKPFILNSLALENIDSFGSLFCLFLCTSSLVGYPYTPSKPLQSSEEMLEYCSKCNFSNLKIPLELSKYKSDKHGRIHLSVVMSGIFNEQVLSNTAVFHNLCTFLLKYVSKDTSQWSSSQLAWHKFFRNDTKINYIFHTRDDFEVEDMIKDPIKYHEDENIKEVKTSPVLKKGFLKSQRLGSPNPPVNNEPNDFLNFLPPKLRKSCLVVDQGKNPQWNDDDIE